MYSIFAEVLSVWQPNGKKTPPANDLSPIILLQKVVAGQTNGRASCPQFGYREQCLCPDSPAKYEG